MAKRVIISGGGTGGHIFPAVSIANALKRIDMDTQILLVGADGRMEMERVPKAGYRIIGLDIQGFQRGSILKNIALPYKILKSVIQAGKIIREFKPDVAVGVGGYASGPLLYMASRMKVPYLIQEQNSYAGITNKKLGRNARKICVAFEGMERFFPAGKIVITGNPIRKESVDIIGKRDEALSFFGLSSTKKTILLIGGSLGAGTLNNSLLAGLDKIIDADVQVIWQTGKYYYKSLHEQIQGKPYSGIKMHEFLERMDLAYAAADLVISRAGAGTLSELYAVKKAVILVPSPNVAEDHQTKNATALEKNGAAVLIKDSEAIQRLIGEALQLIDNIDKCREMAAKIGEMALPDADEVIARHVLSIAN